MCKKNLSQCRTHDDLCAYAAKHGGRVTNGGRHTKIYGPQGGMVTVPHHPGDLAKGTRFSIIKAFIALGMGLFVLSLAGVF